MLQNKKISFIINPISGTENKDTIPGLIDKYIDTETNSIKVFFTEYAGHAFEIAQTCTKEGYDIVVAVGGDGTVNEVARALTHTNTALGIIPCGSGNGLARHLLLPIDIVGALKIISKGVIHDLDYGIINNHPFFCTCGMGFDAFISKKFAEAGKRGKLTYLENVLKEGLKYEPETYELTLDGKETEPHKAFLVSIANASQYGNDAYIAPQASMSDGFLDVVILEPFDILEAPQVGIDLMNKTINKSSKIKSFKAKSIQIHRSKPGVIHFDGDPVDAEANINIELMHQGIKMVVNSEADKSKRKPSLLQTMLSQFINDINTMRGEVNQMVAQQVSNVTQHAVVEPVKKAEETVMKAVAPVKKVVEAPVKIVVEPVKKVVEPMKKAVETPVKIVVEPMKKVTKAIKGEQGE